MAVIALSGQRRDQIGKGAARKSRAAGLIPGVLYGHGQEPIPVAIRTREFQLALHRHEGGNAIVNLDVQYDPLSHDILHLDFQHISLTETIEIKVALHLQGTPVGVKDGGGILEFITRDIQVRCLPTAMPPSIDVDVTHLNIGDSIHVRELSVPEVTVLTDLDTTIATVVPPTVIEEKPAEEAAAAPAEAEPEVIAKGKKEEGEAEGKEKEKEKK